MTLYRKPQPYRKPRTYRGDEIVVPVVSPNTLGGTALPWIDADDHSALTEFDWAQAQAANGPTANPWHTAHATAQRIVAAWQQADQHGFDAGLPWGSTNAFANDATFRWLQASPNATQVRLPWSQFRQRLAQSIGAPWITPDTHSIDAAMRWGTLARHSASTSLLWRHLAQLGAYVALPWGTGSNYQTGYITPYVNPPDAGSSLHFPNLPVYIMIPTITALVIAGGADLKPLAVTITGDVDSWCWALDMQIPAETFALVNPGTATSPVAIRVTVNGYAWSFIVESYTDNRKWGAKGYTVRGRSQSAALADPYFSTRTLLQASDFNAAQLAGNELASTGWTMIWDAVDWLVPGGTWSYNDLTPIVAIQQLAEAVGGVLQTDPDALNLRVEPRYPEKPWQWPSATPYAIVPAAMLDAASGDWRGGNNPNGIYVYPQNATNGAFVRLTGSAGDVQIPMVVHAILTDSGAQAQRGTQELAKAGRIKHEQILIPLLPAPASPGLVPMQKLLQWTDENGASQRGQVMGIQITGTHGGGAVSVRQVLTIERQFRS